MSSHKKATIGWKNEVPALQNGQRESVSLFLFKLKAKSTRFNLTNRVKKYTLYRYIVVNNKAILRQILLHTGFVGVFSVYVNIIMQRTAYKI